MSAAWRRYLQFFGPDIAADVDDEFRFHLETRAAEYQKLGLSSDEAARAARDRVGNVNAIARVLRHHDQTKQRRAGVPRIVAAVGARHPDRGAFPARRAGIRDDGRRHLESRELDPEAAAPTIAALGARRASSYASEATCAT